MLNANLDYCRVQKVLSPGVWLLCCARLKFKDHLIHWSKTFLLLPIYTVESTVLPIFTVDSTVLQLTHYSIQPRSGKLHTLAAVLFLKVIAAENGERPDLSLAVRSMPGQPLKTIMIAGGCYFCLWTCLGVSWWCLADHSQWRDEEQSLIGCPPWDIS